MGFGTKNRSPGLVKIPFFEGPGGSKNVSGKGFLGVPGQFHLGCYLSSITF